MRKAKYLFEMHCHSSYSRDCLVSVEQILNQCLKIGLSGIALTDHNEIEGAKKLSSIAPSNFQVIIGEEISTQSGDIIGLFLKKRIDSGMTALDTIAEIKRQGGLVFMPHPFDRIRKEAIRSDIYSIYQLVDAVEIFNSRTIIKSDNDQALKFAHLYQLPTFVGSDAHLLREYGSSVVGFEKDPRPLTSSNLCNLLTGASLYKRKNSYTVHLITAISKLIKKYGRKNRGD